MASALQAASTSLPRSSLLEYLSIPRELALGYVGLLLFMMGDGVESGYLAHFLHGEGISPEKIALLFTVYGALAAMGARYSGALSDVWGPRLVMWIGLLAWTVFQVIFLGFSLPTGNFPTMLVSYGLRGFGYLVHRRNWLLVDTEGNSIANLVGTLQLGTRNLRFQELTTCRAFRHSLVLPSTRSHILVINSGSSSQKLSGSRPTTTSSLLCRASEAFNKLIGPLPFDDFRFVDAVFVRAMARKT